MPNDMTHRHADAPRTPRDRMSLVRLYVGRGVMALVWAVAFAVHHATPLDAAAVVLLVAYPLMDAVSSFIDLRALPDGSGHRVTLFNGILSALAAVAVGAAASSGVEPVLHAFGAWAVVSGIAQVVVGLRRRGSELGKQLPVLIAGSLSFLVGVSYNIQAVGESPTLDTLVNYAGAGGAFFVIQAALLVWRARQSRAQAA